MHYLNDPKTNYPLIILNAENERSLLGDDTPTKSINNITSCETDELISKWLSVSSNRLKKHVIYRFCGSSMLSSEIFTLVQSVTHQLCYLFGAHESLAFDNLNGLVENLRKIYDHYVASNTSIETSTHGPNQTVIILDRIDLLISSKQDLNNLVQIIKSIYLNSSNSQQAQNYTHQLKFIFTYKVKSLFTAMSRFIEPLQELFEFSLFEKSIEWVNLPDDLVKQLTNRYSSSLYRNQQHKKVDHQSTLSQNLSRLFGCNSSESTQLWGYVIDALLQLLNDCRYGVKQSEIIDILGLYAKNNLSILSGSSNNQLGLLVGHQSTSLQSSNVNMDVGASSNTPWQQQQQLSNQHTSFVITFVWLTLKYYYRLQSLTDSLPNMIKILIENNQLLFRLERSTHELLDHSDERQYMQHMQQQVSAVRRHSQLSLPQVKFQNKLKFKKLLYDYYQSSIDKSTCLPCKSPLHSPLIYSCFNQRTYQELPEHFCSYYLSQQIQSTSTSSLTERPLTDRKLALSYLHTFILNSKWLLNKSLNCDSGRVLYFVHDIEKFKRLLLLLFTNREQQSSLNNSNEENEFQACHQEFVFFEELFYKVIYSLYNDPNQLLIKLKSHSYLSVKASDSNYLNKYLQQTYKDLLSAPIARPHTLVGINYEHLMRTEFSEALDQIKFNTLSQPDNLLSKVIFLTPFALLTISDTHNEIKIWRICLNSAQQSSSLSENNKGQQFFSLLRAIKFNKKPRDLRLLNEHLAVVLLERNLHLIDLYKCFHLSDLNSTMNPNYPFFEIHDEDHVVLLARNRLSVILMKISSKSGNLKGEKKASDDDMFLFKVGEDRYLQSLLVSRNGHYMVCGDEVQKPFPLLVWNLKQRKLIHDLRQPKSEFQTSIQSISSSGKYVICACQVN
jgi:hypothetical protein